jgi:hypothetical protein
VESVIVGWAGTPLGCAVAQRRQWQDDALIIIVPPDGR